MYAMWRRRQKEPTKEKKRELKSYDCRTLCCATYNKWSTLLVPLMIMVIVKQTSTCCLTSLPIRYYSSRICMLNCFSQHFQMFINSLYCHNWPGKTWKQIRAVFESNGVLNQLGFWKQNAFERELVSTVDSSLKCGVHRILLLLHFSLMLINSCTQFDYVPGEYEEMRGGERASKSARKILVPRKQELELESKHMNKISPVPQPFVRSSVRFYFYYFHFYIWIV